MARDGAPDEVFVDMQTRADFGQLQEPRPGRRRADYRGYVGAVRLDGGTAALGVLLWERDELVKGDVAPFVVLSYRDLAGGDDLRPYDATQLNVSVGERGPGL